MSDEPNDSGDSSGNRRELSESRRDAYSEQVTANAERVEKSGSREGGDGPTIDEIGFGHIPAEAQTTDSSTSDTSDSSDN